MNAARPHTDGEHYQEGMVVHSRPAHVLYKTGDADAPDVIKDSNGEVVLGLCRACGAAEIDLQMDCTPKPDAVARAFVADGIVAAPSPSPVYTRGHLVPPFGVMAHCRECYGRGVQRVTDRHWRACHCCEKPAGWSMADAIATFAPTCTACLTCGTAFGGYGCPKCHPLPMQTVLCERCEVNQRERHRRQCETCNDQIAAHLSLGRVVQVSDEAVAEAVASLTPGKLTTVPPPGRVITHEPAPLRQLLRDLAKALGDQLGREHDQTTLPCHVGICTAAECGRCTRERHARGLIARVAALDHTPGAQL